MTTSIKKGLTAMVSFHSNTKFCSFLQTDGEQGEIPLGCQDVYANPAPSIDLINQQYQCKLHFHRYFAGGATNLRIKTIN